MKRAAAKKDVNKLLKSEWFNKLLTLRHNGGWYVAHRVDCHTKGFNKDGWAEFKEACEVGKKFEYTTGFEPQ